MIRFIDLSNQIKEGKSHFAFYDEANNYFLSTWHGQVFDGYIAFVESFMLDRCNCGLQMIAENIHTPEKVMNEDLFIEFMQYVSLIPDKYKNES